LSRNKIMKLLKFIGFWRETMIPDFRAGTAFHEETASLVAAEGCSR
jgi:hypothetical protein